MGFFELEENEVEVDNSLFVEKYRPTKLADYIGNEHLKDTIGNFIEDGEIPHLLFYGKAGTGKTTLAKLITGQIESDVLTINASDENGIDIIRNKIKNFASTIGFKGKKIIILDEADFLTYQAQATLRNLMETFSKHCRFILTCNYIERISDPIRSRCQEFQIVPPTKQDVAVHITKILDNEGIKYDIMDVVPIIDAAYPDIRKIINTTQLNSSRGTLKLNKKDLADMDVKAHIIEILKSGDAKGNKWKKIRQAVADAKLTDYTELYTHLFDKVGEYAGNQTSTIILMIAETQYKESKVIDKEIQFIALIIQIVAEI